MDQVPKVLCQPSLSGRLRTYQIQSGCNLYVRVEVPSFEILAGIPVQNTCCYKRFDSMPNIWRRTLLKRPK